MAQGIAFAQYQNLHRSSRSRNVAQTHPLGATYGSPDQRLLTQGPHLLFFEVGCSDSMWIIIGSLSRSSAGCSSVLVVLSRPSSNFLAGAASGLASILGLGLSLSFSLLLARTAKLVFATGRSLMRNLSASSAFVGTLAFAVPLAFPATTSLEFGSSLPEGWANWAFVSASLGTNAVLVEPLTGCQKRFSASPPRLWICVVSSVECADTAALTTLFFFKDSETSVDWRFEGLAACFDLEEYRADSLITPWKKVGTAFFFFSLRSGAELSKTCEASLCEVSWQHNAIQCFGCALREWKSEAHLTILI